jgi:hypothetical protein
MFQFVMGKVQEWSRAARDIYSVDPIVFVVLIVACAPFFYFSIYRLVRALAKKDRGGVTVWSSVFLAATVIPYLYVLFFGRNMPWWIYIVLGILLAQGAYSLVRKLREGAKTGRSPAAPAGTGGSGGKGDSPAESGTTAGTSGGDPAADGSDAENHEAR